MTIAHIKSNALRRTLLVISLALFPVVLTLLSLVKAADAFIEEFKDQCWQGGDGWHGLYGAVCECWKRAR